MPKRGENIYKRKDGRWEGRYIKGYNLAGKACYGSCYGKTYSEAKEKLGKIKAGVLAGKTLPPKKAQLIFMHYCDDWLNSRKSRIKLSTYNRYETAINNHIKPYLGNYQPMVLSTQLTDKFCQHLLYEKKLAPQTVKCVLVILKSILKYTERQFPKEFPIIDIYYPKDTKKQIRVLTREEQDRFVAYLLKDMDDCKFGILLALMTGVRLGEICALRWDDISISDKSIRVKATMQRLTNNNDTTKRKTRIYISNPKTDTSIRTIPLSNRALALCQQMGVHPSGTYVLTGTNQWIEPRTLQYRIKKYTKECGLENVHFHTTRHTFATRCVEAGFEIKSLSEILGHSSVSITLDRYVHSSMELKRTNMEKLSNYGL